MFSAGHENLGELLDSIDMELYLDMNGVDYRVTSGTSGTQINIRECPVCGNEHYKVYINAETGLGNCFSGDHPPDRNFNKWHLIKALLGDPSNGHVISHIKQAARDMGWRPPKPKIHVEADTSTLEMPESIALPVDGKQIQYLWGRNIRPDTTAHFGLRFCDHGFFGYMRDGEQRWQCYSGRVLIPVFDVDGALVSFQGRDVTGEQDRKYLFPPGYSATGRHLFNAHNALGADSIVINEGVFDVMAMWQALRADAFTREVVPVGSFGMELSAGGEGGDQLGVLLRLKHHGLKNITMMWDVEPKAQKRAIKTALLLRQYGFNVRNAVLTSGKDAAEVAGDEARRAYCHAALVDQQYAMKQLITNG